MCSTLEILHGKLQAELERIVDEYEGVAGVHLVDLTSGDRFGVNDELLFPQASTIKVPMLLELFRRAESEPGLLRRRVELLSPTRCGPAVRAACCGISPTAGPLSPWRTTRST